MFAVGDRKMIVSRLPPAEPSGDVAASIHTPTFNCFVSTAPANGKWETLIVQGDPGVDEQVIPCARLFYPAAFQRADVYKIHDSISDLLNNAGESGTSLVEVAAFIVRAALTMGAERAFENYVSLGGGIYRYDEVTPPPREF
jgi:hypothetical protein